jgi:CubicO group peptidase (beta-lactamase class C family)
VEGGIRKYIGVWRAGSDGYYLWNGVDWNGFVAKWQELAPQGLRLVDMCSYVEDGTRKYLGVWRGGSDGYALYGGLSWEDFVAQWQSLGQENERLIRIERYVPKVQWAKAFRDALQGKAVGWAYAVNQGGNLVDSGASGYARAPWESSTPGVIMATTTRMPIASVSKPITALALLKLLQNNLAALDQPFYPYVASRWGNPGAGVNTVTLRNLLTMKSGMKLQSALFVDYDSAMQDLISSNLVGTPGVTPLYNNGNFSLLGAVIEALSGQSYVTYVQQQIFAPMGIMLSATPPPQSTGILFYKRQVFSGGGAWFPTLTCSTACGGWNGSVLDLMKFMKGVRNHAVLGATATDKMFNEQLGWYATAGAYGTYYQHNGILYTGDGRGLTTGLIRLAADTDAVLFINTWDFDTIGLLVQAFDNYWA